MKREFLEGLGLDKEVVDKIMKEHGISVQNAKPGDYDDLKEKVKNHEAEVLELNSKITTQENEYKDFETQKNDMLIKIKKFEHKEVKYRVARENNIPYDLADRLSGETEEEMAKDAKLLAAFVAKKEVLPLKTHQEDKVDPYETMVDKID